MGGYSWPALGFLIAAPLLAAIVAVCAHRKGRPAVAWFVYGLALWPLAMIHVLVIWPDRDAIESRLQRSGKWQRCPGCAQFIPREARLCEHCGCDVAAERARKRRLPPLEARSPGVS